MIRVIVTKLTHDDVDLGIDAMLKRCFGLQDWESGLRYDDVIVQYNDRNAPGTVEVSDQAKTKAFEKELNEMDHIRNMEGDHTNEFDSD